MKHFCILLFVVFGFIMKGQDTIRFRNGDVRVGKVSEIGPEEIRYLRLEAPSEPPYVIKRDNVFLIKYQSGAVDTFNRKEPKSVVALSNPPEQKVISREGKIVIKKYNLIYQTEIVDDYKLMKMIEKNTSGDKKNQLITEFEKIKKYQGQQYLFNALGFGGMALGFIGGTVGGIAADNGLIFLAGTGLGIGSVITGGILQKHYKIKRYKQRVKVAQIYNDEYDPG